VSRVPCQAGRRHAVTVTLLAHRARESPGRTLVSWQPPRPPAIAIPSSSAPATSGSQGKARHAATVPLRGQYCSELARAVHIPIGYILTKKNSSMKPSTSMVQRRSKTIFHDKMYIVIRGLYRSKRQYDNFFLKLY
jgi:hypothetical protein